MSSDPSSSLDSKHFCLHEMNLLTLISRFILKSINYFADVENRPIVIIYRGLISHFNCTKIIQSLFNIDIKTSKSTLIKFFFDSTFVTGVVEKYS